MQKYFLTESEKSSTFSSFMKYRVVDKGFFALVIFDYEQIVKANYEYMHYLKYRRNVNVFFELK